MQGFGIKFQGFDFVCGVQFDSKFPVVGFTV